MFNSFSADEPKSNGQFNTTQARSLHKSSSLSFRTETHKINGENWHIEHNDNATRAIITDPADGHVTYTLSLPHLRGRYHLGDSDVLITADPETGDVRPLRTSDLAKRETWAGLSLPEIPAQSVGWGKIWGQVLRRIPQVPPSPRIEQGLPPRARRHEPLVPNAQGEEDAKQALAELGTLMSPTGRVLAGMALMAPLAKACGLTSMIVNIEGRAGCGKTRLAKTLAAFFGEQDGPNALWQEDNTTKVGLLAFAQQESYFPLFLDEIGRLDKDKESSFRNLVSGANRIRATRAGAAAADPSSWYGICFTTSNERLHPQQELFIRRLLQPDTSELWPETTTSQRAWAMEVDRLTLIMAGWPWRWLQNTISPGDSAQIQAWVHEHAAHQAIESDTSPDIARHLSLALAGCQYLAQWSGNDTWRDGAVAAAQDILQAHAQTTESRAKQAIRRLLEHVDTHPGMWADDARERMGWLKEESGENLAHIFPPAWEEITGTDLRAISADKNAQAAFIFPNDKEHLSSKKTPPSAYGARSARTRVYTLRIDSAREIIDTADAAAAHINDLPPAQPAPTPQETKEPTQDTEPQPETTTPSRVFLAVTDTSDLPARLDEAATGGVSDIVIPESFESPGEMLEDSAWDVGAWQGRGAGTARHENLPSVRVWTVKNDPATYASGLQTLHDQHGLSFPTPAALVTQMMWKELEREKSGQSRAKSARFRLKDDEIIDLFSTKRVTHHAQWGAPPHERAEMELTQFDKNKSHLCAMTSATLAPLWPGEDYEHYTTGDIDLDNKAGLVRMTTPAWYKSALPSPSPAKPGEEEQGRDIWVSVEIADLYDEAHERGWCDRPEITEAYLAPAHRVGALRTVTDQLKTWVHGDDPGLATLAKAGYQSFAGKILSERTRTGKQNSWYRPDWGLAIKDAAWASAIRTTWAAYKENPIMYRPVAINTDAVYYEGSNVPPAKAIKIGQGLGEWKEER